MARINIYSFTVYRILELSFVEDITLENEEASSQASPNASTGQVMNDPSTAASVSVNGPTETRITTNSQKGMKVNDEVKFFYKESNQSISLPWNWNEISALSMLNAPVPTFISQKIPYNTNANDYVYVLMMPIDNNGVTYKNQGKEVVVAYIGRVLSSPAYAAYGVQGWSIGAPSFSPGEKHYNKYVSMSSAFLGTGLVSNGFKLLMISSKNNILYRIDWPNPTILMYETSRLFSINVAAMYDPATRMTHLFTTHAGNCGGEYSGSGGITLQEQIIDDDTWEQKNVPIPKSVLNSYLIGDAPLRSEGGYCLGPLPGWSSLSLNKADATTQQKGGTGPQFYDAAVSYDFLATKIVIKNTVDGRNLNEAFKSWAGGVASQEPHSFRLANYTSSFEASSGYKKSFGEDGSVPPALPGSNANPTPSTSSSAPGGGLPYDGSYFEQFMTPPTSFVNVGSKFVPYIASNSHVDIYPPSSPLKKIIAPGEPVFFQGVQRNSVFRAPFPVTPVNVPRGTSVKKREYVSGLSIARQMDYQDQCEGTYLYPYYGSSPTAACDMKGNHYIGVETSTGSAQSSGRVDLAYSRGLQGQFAIIRDVTTRQVVPPSAAELRADEQRKESDPDTYAKINDPNPAPLEAILPRLLVDNALPFIYVFFVYKSYIWCKIIPTELFHSLTKSDGQLSIEDEMAISHKIRGFYTVKVTSFYLSADAYSSSPGDYSVFQDKHGDIYAVMEDNYPLEPTLKNYQEYPYQELVSTLKIVKSVNGGMNWTSILPRDFSWFAKRRRTRMCISGYSSTCDNIYVAGGPRNMECLYDPDLHVLNLFFMMYGCIMYTRIAVELLQTGDEDALSSVLKRLTPYIIYGSLSPSIDVQGTILVENDAIIDATQRGITCSKDVIRRGRADSGIMIPHRRGAVRTTRGNYRLFFLDERYRYTSLMSFDCGSTWYTEPEVLQLRT